MSHTVTLNLADEVFEPIASGAAEDGVTVETWIEQRLPNLWTAKSEIRKRLLAARARQIMEKARARTAHLSEEEIEKIVDDAIQEVRQRGRT